MWLMLQEEVPDNYVVATNKTNSVQQFVELAFDYVGLKWQDHVVTDPRFYRPAEVEALVGNPVKTKRELGWQARCSLVDLVHEMVDEDCRLLGWLAPAKQSGASA